MYAKLILIRHGQSEYNLQNRFTGWHDVGLTEMGQHEAHAAGMQLKEEKIDVAFTSMLKRAQRTLDIILNEHTEKNIAVIKNEALNERKYGELEGLKKTDVAKKYGAEQVHIWRRSYDVSPPGGESLKDTGNRVVPYFQQEILPKLKEGKNILIVAHGNSLRSLIMFIEDLTPDQILSRELALCVPLMYNKEW